jgi:hypothetical protein
MAILRERVRNMGRDRLIKMEKVGAREIPMVMVETMETVTVGVAVAMATNKPDTL